MMSISKQLCDLKCTSTPCVVSKKVHLFQEIFHMPQVSIRIERQAWRPSVTVNFKWYDRENPLYSVNVRWGLISRNQLFLDHACKRLFSLFIFLCIEDKCLHVSNDVLGMFMVIVCCLLYGSRPYQQQFVGWWNWVSNDKRNFEEQYGHWNSSGTYLFIVQLQVCNSSENCLLCQKSLFFVPNLSFTSRMK